MSYDTINCIEYSYLVLDTIYFARSKFCPTEVATGPPAQELQIPTYLIWLFAWHHCTSAFTIAAWILMDSIVIIAQSAWASVSLPLSTRQSCWWTAAILIGGRFAKRMNNVSFTTSICWNSPPGTCHTIISAGRLYVLARELLSPSITNVKGGTWWAKHPSAGHPRKELIAPPPPRQKWTQSWQSY